MSNPVRNKPVALDPSLLREIGKLPPDTKEVVEELGERTRAFLKLPLGTREEVLGELEEALRWSKDDERITAKVGSHTHGEGSLQTIRYHLEKAGVEIDPYPVLGGDKRPEPRRSM